MTQTARGLLGGAVFLSLALLAPGGAIAQETIEGASGSEIVVEAPRTVPVPVERSPYTGAAIAVISIKLPVFYMDLDLTTEGDRASLHTRIENVARDACRYLDRMYPLTSDPQCADKAVGRAKAAAIAAIQSAGG
jgi:UrcA family protein